MISKYGFIRIAGCIFFVPAKPALSKHLLNGHKLKVLVMTDTKKQRPKYI